MRVVALGGDVILASRRKGERHRVEIEAAAGVAHLVVLDFEGAEVLTPSYFFGSLWFLWERQHVEQCSVLVNVPEPSYDDVELVTKLKRTPIWAARYPASTITSPTLLGDLETTDSFALEQVFNLGSVSASEMAVADDVLSVTGWNNRLAGLWQKKVLTRRRHGRMFRYALPWRSEENG
ncbi:hypothetical protein [Enhygromyxa salina]|uniref:hypothetical protein n=1 Tax=Enhygromyxa salina TaxID=215803 RepID=UPI0011B27104|nr:hypothetical protein [Enhygromyxa salina]